jgi:hypothetical protein
VSDIFCPYELYVFIVNISKTLCFPTAVNVLMLAFVSFILLFVASVSV